MLVSITSKSKIIFKYDCNGGPKSLPKAFKMVLWVGVVGEGRVTQFIERFLLIS